MSLDLIDCSETAERAYLAGILDGESNMGLAHARQHSTTSVMFRITVRHTNKELIDWLALRWGGKTTKGTLQNPRAKDTWVWWANGRDALPILKIVLPYLRVKPQQAVLGIEWIETLSARMPGKWSRSLTSEQKERRLEVEILLAGLNRRGRQDVLS